MNKITKACNFYVSEWHLFAALLPYLKNQLKEKNKIVIISQDNLKNGIEELVKKIDIKFENENGLGDISWLNENFMLEIKDEYSPINIIVRGTLEFITDINKYLKDNLEIVYRNLTIINCYEVFDTNNMLYNILDEHQFVFNTGGMHEKNEIFPGYKSSEKAELAK